MLPILFALTTASWGQVPAPEAHNHHPIALVGGFSSWGREELLGAKYWGGLGRDIQEDLKLAGHETVTPAVAPFSSNWDRACELYAILKGGRVDYGRAHSERFGHARYGRTHIALLKDWGEPDGSGRLHKVHLVAHSQGGQTSRMVTQLLAEGDATERAATPAEELSPLFQGGHPWVMSVTSLATPHNGTTMTWMERPITEPAQALIAYVASLLSTKDFVYDVKLDQWGLQQKQGESLKDYLSRISDSPLGKSHDFAPWDLSPEGAAELNAWVRAQPQVFYFSWSTKKTWKDWWGHCHPRVTMNATLWQGSEYMGRTTETAGTPTVNAGWFPNDGVVNTISMAGSAQDAIQPYGVPAQPGHWNQMGTLDGWDHLDVIGWGLQHGGEILPFYRDLANTLSSLDDE